MNEPKTKNLTNKRKVARPVRVDALVRYIYRMANDIQIENIDCLQYLGSLETASIDCICTDPPYKYLKGQKLDRDFDEYMFFNECQRVLKDGGFVIMFGRGKSFYRWNYLLGDFGLNFKEEIIWNKRNGTSQFHPISRMHETVSIHCKGDGSVKKTKIPYLQERQFRPHKVQNDIERILSGINCNELEEVKRFVSGDHDRYPLDNQGKHGVTTGKKSKKRSKPVMVLKSITGGMREKSIIIEPRPHYDSIHPTQKPIALLRRLLKLVTDEGDLVFDPFMGSASTGIAAYKNGLKFIGCEIDEEYFEMAKDRLNKECRQQQLL